MSHHRQHSRFQGFAVFDDVGFSDNSFQPGRAVVFHRDGITQSEHNNLQIRLVFTRFPHQLEAVTALQ